MSDEKIQCEYTATASDESILGCPGEHVSDKTVYCEAEADVVLRPPGGSLGIARDAKNVFCRPHAQYLRNEAPKAWEQCSENPEWVRE